MIRVALIGALLCAGVGVAAAQSEHGVDPGAVHEIARGFGFATMDTGVGETPQVRGRMDGTAYTIAFPDCANAKACEIVLFWALWSAPSVTLEKINAWNQSKRFTRALIDPPSDAVLEMVLNYKHRTLDAAQFTAMLHLWRVSMADYDALLAE